jgi:nitrogen fixation NifU-like protein
MYVLAWRCYTMQTFYSDYLLDHYRHPRNAVVVADANCASEQHNPACGDSVSMTAYVNKNDIVQDICFRATGCVICVAGASLLSDQIKGRTLEDVTVFDAQAMIALLGIPIGPTRLKCALLSIYALKDGINNYAKDSLY